MKKVFSVKKYEEVIKKDGCLKEEIESYKEFWANDCEGLTAEEMMTQYGCVTHDDWMIKVKGVRK